MSLYSLPEQKQAEVPDLGKIETLRKLINSKCTNGHISIPWNFKDFLRVSCGCQKALGVARTLGQFCLKLANAYRQVSAVEHLGGIPITSILAQILVWLLLRKDLEDQTLS